MATEVSARSIRLVDPTGGYMDAGEFRLARRPSDLNGRTLGLLENGRPASAAVLKEIGEVLGREYQLGKVLYFSKHNSALPTQREVVNEILEKCDVLVVGVGD